MLSERPRRRGSYAILWATSMMSIMGFGALAVDLTLVEFARGQTQDIADAAAQAAAIALRETDDASIAEDVARRVVENNDVVGGQAGVDAVQVGIWDGADFAANSESPNAVRVELAQTQQLLLAPLFGFTEFDVAAGAVAAWQEVHAILVVDATNSYSQSNFANARAAAVAFYDMFMATAQPDDRLGMVIFTGQFGVEYTPLTRAEDAEANGIRDDWYVVPTGSKAGQGSASSPMDYGDGDWGCNKWGGPGEPGQNDFSAPLHGCYPQGWREYRDENGTDHAAGMAMAAAMFAEFPDVNNLYRAAVISTDGQPSGTGAHNQRVSDGYSEDRWRYFQAGRGVLDPGSPPAQGDQRGTSEVVDATLQITEDMFIDMDVHTWIVSFVTDAAWMDDVPKGNGYYKRVTNSAEMVPIYQDIARSFPMVLVR